MRTVSIDSKYFSCTGGARQYSVFADLSANKVIVYANSNKLYYQSDLNKYEGNYLRGTTDALMEDFRHLHMFKVGEGKFSGLTVICYKTASTIKIDPGPNRIPAWGLRKFGASTGVAAERQIDRLVYYRDLPEKRIAGAFSHLACALYGLPYKNGFPIDCDFVDIRNRNQQSLLTKSIDMKAKVKLKPPNLTDFKQTKQLRDLLIDSNAQGAIEDMFDRLGR